MDCGTITHTYEGSVDVLVTVSHESAAFYRDLKEQILFDSVLFPMDIPCFSMNGLEINAAMDMGTFLLENGVCNYSGLGDGYCTDDCYWELIKHADYTHDGIREIEFDAVCYIPESSIPYFD